MNNVNDFIEKTYTIPNAADGSGVAAVDLYGVYRMIRITCEDVTGLAGLNLEADVGVSGPVVPLHTQDDAQLWSVAAPSSPFSFVLTHAFGIRWIKLRTDSNVSAETAFVITGLDRI